ncbi:MAG: PadR family transcriptional regulator [Nakamurella sp.]
MSVPRTLLGLLQAQNSSHGYDLKRAHDELFRSERPLAYGQVYATLARLLKNGMVSIDGAESGDGPDRKLYSITDAGVTDLDSWLSSPEQPTEYLHNTLYTKVVLALMADRSAADILDAQRAEHLTAMREFNRRKASGDLADQLICDHALYHLEADLRWMDVTAARLAELAAQVKG